VNDESRYAADSARIYQSDWKNFLFAEDRQSIMLFVRHQDQLNQDGMGKLADEVRQATTSFDFEEVHYAGKCFGQSTYVRLIQKETFPLCIGFCGYCNSVPLDFLSQALGYLDAFISCCFEYSLDDGHRQHAGPPH
jgi:hypothetical protein